MNRRRFLVLAAVAGGLAGCNARVNDRTSTPAPGSSAPGSVAGVDLPVPADEPKGSVPRGAIPAVSGAGVVNDAVGDRPVVVTVTPGDTLVAYDRTVDGRAVEFEPDGAAHVRADGSRWERAIGRAVDGPHEGAALAPANEFPPLFRFTWLDFHPETAV